MKSKMTNFQEILERYEELHPEEAESLSKAKAFLELQQPNDQLVDRTNFVGHFTASCLLVDAVKQRILLFNHPIHKLVLQPGGHFDSVDEPPTTVATRKLLQETPFDGNDIRYLPFDYNGLVPIDIDSHDITPNPAKQEKPHVHHDLRYVFLSVAPEGEGREVPSQNQTGQNITYRWYDLSELNRWTTFSRLYKKLQSFLSRDTARKRFFIGLANEYRIEQQVNSVIVTHILPDAFEFLDAIRQSTNLIGVVPKPKSVDEPTKDRLLNLGIPIIETAREDLRTNLEPVLDQHNGNPTVLLDIGGWFEPLLPNIGEIGGGNILGIVEDTKNGENKYVEYAKENAIDRPIVSVAESELKANEDYLVGKSIVFSTDVLLRECGLVLDHLECAVIGYGKIGRSIAQHLLRRGIKPIVVEKEPLRRLSAYRENCNIRHRDWANQNVDLIFCATGNRATDIIDFRSLRAGTFVVSVTSSDDEFDVTLLPEEYELSKHDSCENVTRCDGKVNHFYLVNDGNAVNFLHNAVLWEFIQLVKGGIFISMKNLVDGKPLPKLFGSSGELENGLGNLFQLSQEDQQKIAKLWMETVLLGVKLEE